MKRLITFYHKKKNNHCHLPASIETLYDIFHAKNTLCKYELDLFLVILFNIKPCVMQAASRKQLQTTGSSFF